MKTNILALSIATALLTGCGGGGGGGTTAPTQPDSVTPTPVTPTPAVPDGSTPAANYSQITSEVSATVWRDNGYDGTGVKVAVLDTGWTAKAELSNTSAITNQTYEINYTTNKLEHTGNTQTADTSNKHGEYMATVIAGQTLGVAPGATLYSGFVSNASGSVSQYNVAGGVRWAINDFDAHIINGSFSPTAASMLTAATVNSALKDDFNEGFNALDSKNRLIILGAGNGGLSGSTVSQQIANYSADFTHLVNNAATKDNVLIVGALADGNFAAYSDAAGSNVNVQDRYLLTNGQAYSLDGTVTGTSVATAVASGVASLMQQRWSHLGGSEISKIMIDTADRSFAGYSRSIHGMGKLDAVAAFTPVGTSVVGLTSVTNASIPVQSLSLTLPNGVSPTQSINYAAFDSYGRDFMYSASARNMPTTNVADAMAGFTGSRTVEKDGTVMTVANGFANADVKLSDSLSIQSSMTSRGQERFEGMSFMGFSNFSTTAGLDSMYTTGFSNKLSANQSFNYGLMYGERQTNEGIKQSNGVYMGYKNGGMSVSFNALNNPQSFSGASLLSADQSMLMSLDTRYQANGAFAGVRADNFNGSGSQMMQSFNMTSVSTYVGFTSQLNDVWSFGMAAAYKQTNGNMDVNLPFGRTVDGTILMQDTSIGLSGTDRMISTSLTANFGETKVVTQGMANDRDKGLLIGISKTF